MQLSAKWSALVVFSIPVALAVEGLAQARAPRPHLHGRPVPVAPPTVPPVILPPPEAPASGSSCAIPADAQPLDTSLPDRVVGSGTPASCTGQAVIDAVALGGKIRFNCGPDPVVIELARPAKVFNDASDDVVIDGGNLVTLSGGGATRILYMNTCDPEQHWTTSHCDDQATPRLTVQNLTFANGNSSADTENDGGGAIWARGGRLKVINSRFYNNTCIDSGPDVAGAAIRAFSQYQNLPLYVVGSTFGGAEGLGNACSNGGGIGSIEVNWTIIDSVFSYNRAVGFGGNPAAEGTPGGGSGGAIYNDGETMTLSLCNTRIENNQVREFGSGIFFVSNNHQGTLQLQDSLISGNTGGEWNVQPGVSMHEDTTLIESGSTLQ
jgi:hypothetical protein